VFKVVPSPFWRPIYLKCRETAMGSEADLAKNWKKAVAYFDEFKVTEAHLLAWLDLRSVKDVQRVHVGRLRGLVTAIKDGDTTVEEAFADVSIVTMPQRESATMSPSRNGNGQTPEPPTPDLILTKLQKKETTSGSPYWVVEFSNNVQAITFSTTWGGKLEQWDLAGRAGQPIVFEKVDVHKAAADKHGIEWTYLDDVKPVV
jgi:hypothetical protein